jgi:hypothetical protein
MTGCTFLRNSADGYGGGYFCSKEVSAIVTNSIFRDNDAAEGPEIGVYGSSTLEISYSDVEGGLASVFTGSSGDIDWGAGMIDADPLFLDMGLGDLHLTHDSPCRDSGDNSAVTELYDFEGDPRIAYGTVDMGADEFYTHLYVTGDKTPGGSIQGKFIGLPGTTPVGLFIGSDVLAFPLPTMWGEYWLQAPYILLGPLGAIPSDGVLLLPTTLPGTIPAPYDVPMQALIGLNEDSLTNLEVLEVR